MTANTYSREDPAASARASRLKQALVEFATTGDLGLEFQRQKKSTPRFKGALDDLEEMLALDWFIFDWMDEDGAGVVDRFLASQRSLSREEQEMVADWGSSTHNVFEICDCSNDRLTLREVDSRANVTVQWASTSASEISAEPGRFLMARLLPVKGRYHFSGPPLLLPDREAALEALELAQSLGVVVSPGEIEEAHADQRNAFLEFFGSSEITLRASEVDESLERFEKYLLFDRRQSQAGMTKAESFRARFGVEVKEPARRRSLSIPEDQEITLLCDEFEGIVLLPRYREFRKIFGTHDPDRNVPDWKALVWNYIKDPDIPIVAFEYIAEDEPQSLERCLRILLNDKGFSLEHLYAMLLHYKEPVEGLDDLKDDEKLWDLLDGKPASKRRPLTGGRKPPQTSRAQKRSGKTIQAASPVKGSAKSPEPATAARRRASARAAAKKTGASKKSRVAKGQVASKKAAIRSSEKRSTVPKKRATATKKRSKPPKKRLAASKKTARG